MGFICPKCTNYSLKVDKSVDLGPDAINDEVAIQIIKCTHCPFKGMGVYKESRRGAMDSEHFHHTGYIVPSKVLTKLRRDMKNNSITQIDNYLKEVKHEDSFEITK